MRFSVIHIILILGISFSIYAQDSITFLSAPKVTAREHYTMNEGLPSTCLQGCFVDSKGRLWLNPCEDETGDIAFSFFQFDGRRSIFYDLKPAWLPEGTPAPIWIVHGETTTGCLFGFDRNRTSIFY